MKQEEKIRHINRTFTV